MAKHVFGTRAGLTYVSPKYWRDGKTEKTRRVLEVEVHYPDHGVKTILLDGCTAAHLVSQLGDRLQWFFGSEGIE